MKGTEQEQALLDDDLTIEKGFNDALDNLRKSLNGGLSVEGEAQEDLEKAKGKMPPQFKKDSEEEPEEDEDEDEEEEEARKSIEDYLNEEPEAAAAMDIEPFLLQLAKALDESLTHLHKSVGKRVAKVEALVKSIGAATVGMADLQKSTREIVKRIGGEAVPTGSVRTLRKARFGSEGNIQEFEPRVILAKSRDWVKTGKIDLLEAGNIETRINKGRLGRIGDQLDQKVEALMREAG